MGVQDNLQIVKDGYAALGRTDIPGLPASFAEDNVWRASTTCAAWRSVR